MDKQNKMEQSDSKNANMGKIAYPKLGTGSQGQKSGAAHSLQIHTSLRVALSVC